MINMAVKRSDLIQLHVWLPAPVKQKLKLEAVKRGTSMATIIERLTESLKD
jgi:hypothetical protein